VKFFFPKSKVAMTDNTIGQLHYDIHDVRGDGNCFYRAIYNILQESEKGKKEFDLDGVDEDEGVENIRAYIATVLRSGWEKEAIDSIHMICDILGEGDPDLYQQLEEIYPFVNDKLCTKKGVKRIEYVADLIEDTSKEPMYASEIEKDIVKRALEAVADMSIIVISKNNEDHTTLMRKWKRDLLGLLQNSTKKNVAVLLNKNNVHYQYLSFKRHSNENKYHTIVNRQMALRYLTNTIPQTAIMRGGRKFRL
jgi:hypothetical protein